MSEMTEIESAVVDVLRSTVNTMGDAKEFILAEMPDYVMQLVSYYQIRYGIITAILLMVALFLVWLSKWGIKMGQKSNHEEPWALIVILTIPGILAFGGEAISRMLEFVKITVAPKVWLVEYIAQLAK